MSQQAGWYDDPEDDSNLRYWDGVQWTSHTSPKQKPGLDRAGQGQQGIGEAGQGSHSSAGQQGGSGWGQQGQQGQQGQWGGSSYGQQGQQGQQGQWGGSSYGQQGQQGQQGQWGGNPYGQQGQPSPYGQWQTPMPGGYPMQTDPRSVTPDGQPLAGWWHRVAARILDAIVLIVLSLAAGMVLLPGFFADYIDWSMTQTDPLAMPPAEIASGVMQMTLLTGVLGLIYEVVLVALLGGTLGKLATGLRVRLREEPGNPGWTPSLLRALVYQGPGILGNLSPAFNVLGLFTLINVLWPLWDKKRQALHDKVAKTNVVKRG